jgi:hypothetical protein
MARLEHWTACLDTLEQALATGTQVPEPDAWRQQLRGLEQQSPSRAAWQQIVEQKVSLGLP